MLMMGPLLRSILLMSAHSMSLYSQMSPPLSPTARPVQSPAPHFSIAPTSPPQRMPRVQLSLYSSWLQSTSKMSMPSQGPIATTACRCSQQSSFVQGVGDGLGELSTEVEVLYSFRVLSKLADRMWLLLGIAKMQLTAAKWQLSLDRTVQFTVYHMNMLQQPASPPEYSSPGYECRQQTAEVWPTSLVTCLYSPYSMACTQMMELLQPIARLANSLQNTAHNVASPPVSSLDPDNELSSSLTVMAVNQEPSLTCSHQSQTTLCWFSPTMQSACFTLGDTSATRLITGLIDMLFRWPDCRDCRRRLRILEFPCETRDWLAYFWVSKKLVCMAGLWVCRNLPVSMFRQQGFYSGFEQKFTAYDRQANLLSLFSAMRLKTSQNSLSLSSVPALCRETLRYPWPAWPFFVFHASPLPAQSPFLSSWTCQTFISLLNWNRLSIYFSRTSQRYLDIFYMMRVEILCMRSLLYRDYLLYRHLRIEADRVGFNGNGWLGFTVASMPEQNYYPYSQTLLNMASIFSQISCLKQAASSSMATLLFLLLNQSSYPTEQLAPSSPPCPWLLSRLTKLLFSVWHPQLCWLSLSE